jgi:hypothetical protein
MQFGRIVIQNRTEQNGTERKNKGKQNNREQTPNRRSGIVNASLCREIGTSCSLRVGYRWGVGEWLVNVETLARYLVWRRMSSDARFLPVVLL